MSDPWPDLAGRLVEDGHVLPVRIYFEDTDFSGLVYHGSYVRFFERGRTDFLRLTGIGHQALARGELGAGGEGLVFAVRSMTLEFLKPARLDETVEVVTRLAELTGARIVLAQTIRRGEEVLVSADVTVAILNAAGAPRRLPAEIAASLAASRSS